MQTFAVRNTMPSPPRMLPRRLPEVRRIANAPSIQTKLAVGAANDPAEDEADRVAGQVMRMPDTDEPVRIGPAAPAVQRACADCAEEDDKVHRSAAGSDGASAAPEIVRRVLRQPGQKLDSASRSFFEPRFGFDLSDVRVHTGSEASRSAQAVNAHAYAAGRDIVFAEGQYSPGSAQGRHVLAHELAHVAQQSAPSATGGVVHRLVNTASTHCTAAKAGIANPHTGTSDRRASSLLDNAITQIVAAQGARAANPADAGVVAAGNALRTAFGLNPANADTWTAAAPAIRLPVILRRLQAAKSYIDSVVFTVTCLAIGETLDGAGNAAPSANPAVDGCDADTEAFSYHTNPTRLALCPLFWTRDLDQRGRIWMHEVLHITFVGVDDWTAPNVGNAHCYAQFVALLNGFNSTAEFRCS
jgi:hypothetical protein